MLNEKHTRFFRKDNLTTRCRLPDALHDYLPSPRTFAAIGLLLSKANDVMYNIYNYVYSLDINKISFLKEWLAML